MRFTVKSLSELDSVAEAIIKHFPAHRVFAFYGSMGVGKTTLIKAICKYMQVREIANSPSFAIINEYSSPTFGFIYHFDFYRIKKIEEAFDIGYEEYFYSGSYCFIEWPEKIENLLPESLVRINIIEEDGGERRIETNIS